jgi:hypothetical protein
MPLTISFNPRIAEFMGLRSSWDKYLMIVCLARTRAIWVESREWGDGPYYVTYVRMYVQK